MDRSRFRGIESSQLDRPLCRRDKSDILRTMTLPTYDELIPPLLQVLSAHSEGIAAADAYDAVADLAGISAKERAIRNEGSGQFRYVNRIAWAHTRLKAAKLSDSPKYGQWRLTKAGKTLAAKHPKGLPLKVARQIAAVHKRGTEAPAGAPPNPVTQSPADRIESAVEEHEESVRTEILDAISRATPAFFETLVLKVLHSLGYGANESMVQRTGGSHDRGIDGVISLDRLGLQRVYVQAKRWTGSVGSPEVSMFAGAIGKHHAHMGVMVTASHFTPEARTFASAHPVRIELVDGERLAQLMMEQGIGVTTSYQVRLMRLDPDFFLE